MALGLLATACASDGTDNASTQLPTAAQPEAPDSATSEGGTPAATTPPTSLDGGATAAAPVVVPELLQFTAPLVGGGEFTGADYAGKPTVFWFWAPT